MCNEFMCQHECVYFNQHKILSLKKTYTVIDKERDIENAFKSELVNIQKIVHQKKKNNDIFSKLFICYPWGNDAHEKWVEELASYFELAGFEVSLDQRWDDGGNMTQGDIDTFTERVSKKDTSVIIVATPMLLKKYMCTKSMPCMENCGIYSHDHSFSLSGQKPDDTPVRQHVVRTELDKIERRLKGGADFMFLVVLDGESENMALPKFLRGRVFTDMRPFHKKKLRYKKSATYFEYVFRIISKLISDDGAKELFSKGGVLNHTTIVGQMNEIMKENSDTSQAITSISDRVKRQEDELKLAALLDDNVRVVEINMMGGSGKSLFVKHFLDSLIEHDIYVDHVLWFSFYKLGASTVQRPFFKLIEYLMGHLNKQGILYDKDFINGKSNLECIKKYLNTRKIILVLDGLEIAQKGGRTGDEQTLLYPISEHGQMVDDEFAEFLTFMCDSIRSHLIITTRLALTCLRRDGSRLIQGAVSLQLSDWSSENVKTFLFKEITVDEHVLRLVAKLGRHPLTLALLKGLINENMYRFKINKWEGLKAIIEEVSDIENDISNHLKSNSDDTFYSNEYKKICGIIKQIKKGLNRDAQESDKKGLNQNEQITVDLLSLIYGDISKEQLRMLLERKLELLFEKSLKRCDIHRLLSELCRKLEVLNILKYTGHSLTIHPMIKMGFRSLMDASSLEKVTSTACSNNQIQKRMIIMEFFNSNDKKGGILKNFDAHMEWCHQLTHVIDSVGDSSDPLSDFYDKHRWVMIDLEYSSWGKSLKKKFHDSVVLRRHEWSDPNESLRDRKSRINRSDVDSLVNQTKELDEQSANQQLVETILERRLKETVKRKNICQKLMRELNEFKPDDLSKPGNWEQYFNLAKRALELKRANESGIYPNLLPYSDIDELESFCRSGIIFSLYLRTLFSVGEVYHREIIRSKMQEGLFFGPEEWYAYFNVLEHDIPKLPENVEEILDSPCPFSKGKKIASTHMLFFVPKTEFKKLRNEVKEFDSLVSNLNRLFNQGMAGRINVSVVPSTEQHMNIDFQKLSWGHHWILMPIIKMELFRNKTFKGQESQLKEILPSYDLLGLIDVIIGFGLICSQVGGCNLDIWRGDCFRTRDNCREASNPNETKRLQLLVQKNVNDLTINTRGGDGAARRDKLLAIGQRL